MGYLFFINTLIHKINQLCYLLLSHWFCIKLNEWKDRIAFQVQREIDFVKETVRTLAGNGTKGSDYKGGGHGANQARFHICFTIYFYVESWNQKWKAYLHHYMRLLWHVYFRCCNFCSVYLGYTSTSLSVCEQTRMLITLLTPMLSPERLYCSIVILNSDEMNQK